LMLALRLKSGGVSNFRFSSRRTSMSGIGAESCRSRFHREWQGYSVLRRPRQSGKF